MSTRLVPTIYIVDDEPGPLASLCALVSSMGYHTASYATAQAFLEAYTPDTHGCLITDLRMMEMNGLQLQEELLRLGAAIPVIMITGYAETQVTVQAMRNGAVTLLEKPCRDQQLRDAIREALTADLHRQQARRRREDIANRIGSLSQAEQEVMDLMVAGSLNKTIAAKLNVSIRTVEARRHNIFAKTRTESLAELVQLVMEYQKPHQAESA